MSNYFRVELIGLGNGTACRETESWLKHHHIADDIAIVIVPEQGASVYSVSKEAQKVLILKYFIQTCKVNLYRYVPTSIVLSN